MIFNLTDNAINYNRPQGSVTLTTGTENGRPFVRVADTGIGIAPADQQRVFERFYRVDKKPQQDDRRHRTGAFDCQAWCDAASCGG